MRTRILSCLLAVLVLGSLGLMSCGKDDDDWAPDEIAGKVVTATVTTGSGRLAPAGERFRMTFNADVGRTYRIEALTAGTANSEGTYEYEKMGDDTGEITLLDTTLDITIRIVLTYTAEGRGEYTAEVLPSVVGGTQAGTFVAVEE